MDLQYSSVRPTVLPMVNWPGLPAGTSLLFCPVLVLYSDLLVLLQDPRQMSFPSTARGQPLVETGTNLPRLKSFSKSRPSGTGTGKDSTILT